ncbi:unnamed protein product [Calypogeia fissa]
MGVREKGALVLGYSLMRSFLRSTLVLRSTFADEKARASVTTRLRREEERREWGLEGTEENRGAL